MLYIYYKRIKMQKILITLIFIGLFFQGCSSNDLKVFNQKLGGLSPLNIIAENIKTNEEIEFKRKLKESNKSSFEKSKFYKLGNINPAIRFLRSSKW